jgi:hypothetical protein
MKTMMKLFTMIAVTIFVSSNAIGQITHDQDNSVDFSKYKSYSFLGWQKGSDSLINDIDKQRLVDALKSEMQKRDLNYVESNGDMMITLYLTINNEQNVTAYTNYTGGMGYGMGAGAWGYGAGMGSSSTTYNTYDYQEGTLVMDSYDETSKKLVWEGIYKGAIQSKANKREKTIPKNIGKLMKGFPIEPVKK